MQRFVLALAALACLALVLPAPAIAHGSDKCNQGLLNSAEKQVENELRQALAAIQRYTDALDAGSPSADEKLEKAQDEIADYFAAVADLQAHQAACA